MKQKNVFFIAALLTAGLSYFVQTQLLFSGDVGYLLHAAHLITLGGHYGTDIFETNPPLILYLYLPPVLWAQLTGCSILLSLRFYILLLAFISAIISFNLLKKLISKAHSLLLGFSAGALLFILFFLPATAFAQREHLLIILALPYFFAAALYLQQKPLNRLLALTVGLGAGFGFALKPFFLLSFGLIELWLLWKKRNWEHFFRIELIVLLTVLVSYFYLIRLLEPNYINLVLPFVWHYYFPFARQSLSVFFSPPYVLFCLAGTLSYFYFYRHDRYREIGALFFLGSIGLTAAFFMARTSWYYHVLPALSMTYLLVAHILGQLGHQVYRVPRQALTLVGTSFFVLTVPLYNYYLMLQYGVLQRKDHYKQQIISYINNYPGDHSMVCWPIGTMDCFPLVYQTEGPYASRFPSLWWYNGIRQDELTANSASNLAKDKTFLIDALTEDLERHSVQWIIINQTVFKKNDMLAYLTEDPKFNRVWRSHYYFLKNIGPYQIYKRQVE